MNLKKYQLLHWMQPGQRVWVQQPKGAEPYRKAILDKVSDTKLVCKYEDGSTAQVKPTQIQQRSNSTILHSDLMDVETLNNAQLLQQLKGNFRDRKIYSFVGPTLVITNPYEFYPQLYTKDLKHYYIQKVIEDHANYKDLEPHLYGVVAEVIRTLHKNRINQSILISGESGAGKTEANKECMVLISEYYNQGQQNLHEKVLSCNPLLEAFGNAKTIRNDNSSRFGRFVEISVKGKQIKRATITSYLLQKSRVTSQLQGERNFHIFYAFILGCTTEQKLKYFIPDDPLVQFQYLKNTSMMSVDQQNFQDVKKSFETLGFKESQEVVWKILASILHIGNLKFSSASKADQMCEIVNKNILELIAKLLGLPVELLLKSLSSYQIKVGNESLTKPFTLSEIKQIKDSLSRQLYEKLFNWLITCLNQNLGKQPKGQQPVIGLLDIYGFEVLKTNSFEQLCINFTNERLHQLYIEQVFKGEKIVFDSEGLGQHLMSIQFKDNQQLIDLLDTNMLSVFNLLDEWCTVASTEEAFITNLSYYHKKNSYFPTSNLSSKDSFVIKHTPRDVEYTVTSFREKNKNLLRDDVVAVLRTSSIPILGQMFAQDPMQDKPLNSNSHKIKRFLGSRFRNEMNQLIKSLQDKSELFFIRCIKSNNTKSPGLFEGRVALEQIRYLGILDTIKMRKNSYSVRMKYRLFLDKYPWFRDFLPGKNLDDGQSAFKLIEKYCPKFGQDEVIFGYTKIFLRSYADYQLNSRYNTHLQNLKRSNHIIVSTLRRNLYQQKRKERIQNRAIVCQYTEGFRQFLRINKRTRAAANIQRFYRNYSQQKKLRQSRHSCIVVQKYWRRIIENQKRKRVLYAVRVIEHHYKRHLIKKRFTQYLVVRPIAQKYLIDMTWNMIKFLNKETIEQYLSVIVTHYKNKKQITQFESNIKNFQSVKTSESVQKYFHAITPIAYYNRCLKAATLIQTTWLTTKLRRKFLNLKRSTNVIKKFWKEYYHKRVHSKRIFNKFFESYISDLDQYNEYCRDILFNSKKFKDDTQFYIEQSLRNYLTNYKAKMTIIYYMFDFEAHVMLEDMYPNDSWIENYCRLYKEGLNRNTPVQQIKVTEQSTAVATSHRLYEWGGFKENSDKIHMINATQQVYSYHVNEEELFLNTKEPQPIKDQAKQSSTYKKKFILQHLNVYEANEDVFTQVKIMNISRFGNKEEKVLDISCGDGHTVCKTLSKKVYSWGSNKYGQLGHENYNYIPKPKSISSLQKIQISQPLQISTTSNSTIILMTNRKIYWCGKNGTIDKLNILTELNLENRVIGNNQLFAPLRIQVSYSRTMSIIGATYVSFNNVLDNNTSLRNKLVGIMSNKFLQYGYDLINLPFDKNIANYVTESTIRMPIYKQSIEMESRKLLKNLEEEVKQTLGQDPLDISFSKHFGAEHQLFK